MRVAILGAGAVAYGAAAHLIEAGHEPVLWSPSGQRTIELAAGRPLIASGAVAGVFRPRIATSCTDAIGGADVVMLALPGNGHRTVMDIAAPQLEAGQVVVISSHLSFGALHLDRRLAERGLQIPIVAWGTTLTTGRQRSATEVDVATLRQKIDLAVVPKARLEVGHQVCTRLFGDRFVPREDLVAIALSNLNPQNHMGIALCNLTRMERGERWGQAENVTPAVGRLLEALDAERLAIADAFGVAVRTIEEHFHLSFHVPVASISEMNQAMHAQGRGGTGPATLDSRYVLEDVPFGLVPTALLGRMAGAPAPLHEAGIEIFSALYGRDFRADNDLLPALDIAGLQVAALRQLAADGLPRADRSISAGRSSGQS